MNRINIEFVPDSGGSMKRRMSCPECNQILPIDAVTECDRCGAHLEVKVEVVAGAIGSNNETELHETQSDKE